MLDTDSRLQHEIKDRFQQCYGLAVVYSLLRAVRMDLEYAKRTREIFLKQDDDKNWFFAVTDFNEGLKEEKILTIKTEGRDESAWNYEIDYTK